MEKWKGKVAVVTGASSGIGEAIAIKLVEAGMKVAGFARRVEKVEEISKSLEGKSGCLLAVKSDVTKEEDILKGFKLVAEELGPVQVLINNAGIAIPTTFIDGTTEEWKKILDTNVMGLCICTREAIKAMRNNTSGSELPGHIIHINSLLGHKILALPQSNIYPSSKFAVTASAEVLRNELNILKSQIKVTSVSPGLVKTEILNDFANTANLQKIIASAPVLDPTDVADAVEYVLGTKPHVLISELTIKPVGERE